MESALRERIAGTMRRIRKDRGMSLRDLSDVTGIDKSQLSKIERGEASPRTDTLYRIAKALNVPMSAILDGDGHSDRRLADLMARLPDEDQKEVVEFAWFKLTRRGPEAATVA